MTDKMFWSLIDLLDFKTPIEKGIVEPLVFELSTKSIGTIKGFHKHLAKRLKKLNSYYDFYKDNIDSNGSIDGFLYFRCAVIAEGEDFYKSFIENPNDTDEIGYVSLEELLNVCNLALIEMKNKAEMLINNSELYYSEFNLD